MSQVLTLTMNPALDVSTSIERIEPDHKLRCAAPRQHPGGGGINVARVLHRLGDSVTALYPAGGATGQALTSLLTSEGVPVEVVPIDGETRESFSAHEDATGRDYRFVLPGPTVSDDEAQACLDAVRRWLGARSSPQSTPTSPPWVVASGGLPPGVPEDFHARVARLVRAEGARFVLDSNAGALKRALDEGVHLVKPSLRELRQLTGRPLSGETEQAQAAMELVTSGRACIVALSMGEQGAMWVSARGTWRAQALDVPVASTIGAGDSFVAGIVWALGQGWDEPRAFAHGVAASAAALLASGTALCDPADVTRLLDRVEVRAI